MMNNRISFFLSKFNLLAGLCVLMLAIPLTAGAQQTSGSVRGSVATPDGQPAAGATVTVTDTRTSATRTTTTSVDGTFNVRRPSDWWPVHDQRHVKPVQASPGHGRLYEFI